MAELVVHSDSVKETPRDFALVAGADWWGEVRALFRDPDARLVRPFRIAMQGYRLGARLLFRGRIDGEIELRCSRCGEPVSLSVGEPLELLLEPAQNPGDVPEGGIELDPEDFGLGRYAGDELDFGPVVLEILSLAWPMQPLCSESCTGLCPVCGANRSRQQCSCETRQANRPFAGLGQLLEKSRRK